ncbi:copper chaperone PCu(A)C [Paeniroseomonas aquatica]|uniref:Copper chaperone PCu(A)C n=1 Tax=Paeniroseomonas aquatica TaxID=373043 RepID=A0ABT8ADC0_9PROT|nr:copper chaperone PCu(A)C [Paeniroseomonas aquatica]MDN3567784.1 copper chaperone PCu(A)C [Paeniroseomonas aquatica]
MTHPYRRALLGLLAAIPVAAAAHDAEVGAISVTQPWSRAAGANGTGAGFLTIRNGGTAPDRLLSASSPAARKVELHTHVRDGEVMRMRPVEGIALPPGETVTLRPGGLHVMLIGLTAALVQGGEVPLTLRFERAGEAQVMLHVMAAGARGPTP